MKTPLTIRQTQEGLIQKEFSAVELVDSYLSEIEKKNKDLNVFLTVTSDAAYKKAKEIDGSDKKLPLFGVVAAYKDLYLTKGVRTTAASKVLESYVPEYSATVVKRLEAAGTIMLGKTNCDAWAHGASGENSDFGPTKNPWNKEYVPGGSSSGSAAAVSSGMSLIAMGTDTGGSVRQPANFCGIVGLKPTYGAVSRYGVIAMASSLDAMGSFGHTVDDVEAVFNVLKGGDNLDSSVTDFKEPERKEKYTLGIAKEYFMKGLDREVEENVNKAVDVFKKMGMKVKEISLPHSKYAIPVYYIIQPAEVSSNLGRYDGIRYGEGRNAFGDEAKRRIMLGTYVLSAGYYDAFYLKAQKVRSKLISDFDNAFESVDAIISPVSPTPPFKIGEKSEDPLQMYLADIYTAGANLTGIPGLALPFTFSKKGLPMGFQLMGARFSEEILFDLGKKFHKEIDYKPNIAV
jgi:aspartyl-tRNA(Asn)/glutamyl-tRNA(Gln) amidotransferase subunit A